MARKYRANDSKLPEKQEVELLDDTNNPDSPKEVGGSEEHTPFLRRGINSIKNGLLYDPNSRRQRKLASAESEDEEDSRKESLDEAEDIQNALGSEALQKMGVPKPLSDHVAKHGDGPLSPNNTPINKKAKNLGKELIADQLDAAKQASSGGNSGSVVGGAAKDATKEALKKVGKKIAMFLITHPWVLGIIAGLILFLLIIFYILGKSGDTESGYYDHACNFNESVVNLSTCNSGEQKTITLKDYVLGVTYAAVDGRNLSDDALQAIMIIEKTNALSNGGYNNNSKTLNLDDCSTSYVDINTVDNSVREDFEELYDPIENYIYVSVSYTSGIPSLNSQNALAFDISTLDTIESMSGNSYGNILNTLYNTGDSNNEAPVEFRSNRFIGDSRTQGMQIAGLVNKDNTVYGSGYGYNWLIGNGNFDSSKTNATEGAIAGINSKMDSTGQYNIIIWLGVNDYSSVGAQKYYDKYYELATGEWKNQMIYIVAVGPVDDSKAVYVDNAGINSFNAELSDLIGKSDAQNLKYINLNYSISSYDKEGLHYSSDDYENIYNMIVSNVTTTLNTKLHLYDLGDHCTFYSIVTENDVYWWPVGSATSTNGNVYGGKPTATTVTSGFGMRTLNGTTKMHNGIDISGGTSCFDNVIIASKDGTVIETNDTCPTTGGLGDHCGGSLGNYVKIQHADGNTTTYGHMSSNSIVVKVGDTVSQGQKLGLMGSSGNSTGCHLHFTIKIGGTSAVNPLNYVSATNPRPISASNYVYTINGAGDASNGKEYVCKTLLNSGFSPDAVAGIMVNMQAESGFISVNLQNSYEKSLNFSDASYTMAVDNGAYKNFINDSAGYGLVQWTSAGRKSNLYNYAKSKNTSIGDITMQLEFFVSEVSGYTVTYKYITGTYSAYDIANNFCLDYERPKNKETSCPSRAASNAASMLNYVNNNCS